MISFISRRRHVHRVCVSPLWNRWPWSQSNTKPQAGIDTMVWWLQCIYNWVDPLATFIITLLYQDVLLATDRINLNAKRWTWTDDVFANLRRMLSSLSSSAVRHYINMVPRATIKLQEMPYAVEVHLDNNVRVRLSTISGNLTTVATNERRRSICNDVSHYWAETVLHET